VAEPSTQPADHAEPGGAAVSDQAGAANGKAAPADAAAVSAANGTAEAAPSVESSAVESPAADASAGNGSATNGASATGGPAAEPPPDGGPEAPEAADVAEPATARHRPLILLGVVALVVLALDAVSKQLVLSNLSVGHPKRLIPGVLYLDLIRNSGAAFSFGTNHTWIFPTITIVVIVWIAWMSQRLRSIPWAIAFGLVLGGALGNLSDRLFRAPGPMRGAVVDFISLFSNDGRGFAIFNLADSALCCGVALAILLELLGRHRDGTRQPPAWRSQAEVRD
jgi:signal peptidase II